MHKLSLVSLAALVAVGGILAFVVFVHPAVSTAAPQPQASQHVSVTTTNTNTNSLLLTQPPSPTTGGDDNGSTIDR